MAPESIEGQPGNERSDIFALGVTLFRIFADVDPYGEVEAFSRPRFNRPPSSIAVLECSFAPESGELHATPGEPHRPSLPERDPLRFWQTVSAVLALLLAISRTP